MVNMTASFTHIDQVLITIITTITGWWYTYPSEKYESQLGWWHSQYMESHKKCSKPPIRLPSLLFISDWISRYFEDNHINSMGSWSVKLHDVLGSRYVMNIHNRTPQKAYTYKQN